VTESLNIIACENMVGQTEMLGKYVRRYLSDEENAWLADKIGFANCSVDRIVPAPPHMENPLDVGVEDFSEWAVDRARCARRSSRPCAG
jgi:mannitol-1-phosphate 5-dehydrogenase